MGAASVSPRPTPSLLFLAGVVATCGAPPEPVTAPPPAADPPAVRDLLSSPPGLWPTRVPAALALGPAAAPALAEALTSEPWAPGAQAATAVLASFGGPAATDALERLVADDRAEVAAEAALGLRRCSGPATLSVLRSTTTDPSRPPLVRTAAAATRLDLGDRDAVDFLVAVLTASTPHGVADTRRHGLPADKPRWALERRVAIDCLQRHLPAGSIRLHPDAPWPDLEAQAQAVRRALADGGR